MNNLADRGTVERSGIERPLCGVAKDSCPTLHARFGAAPCVDPFPWSAFSLEDEWRIRSTFYFTVAIGFTIETMKLEILTNQFASLTLFPRQRVGSPGRIVAGWGGLSTGDRYAE
jgi:hypothetical protein